MTTHKPASVRDVHKARDTTPGRFGVFSGDKDVSQVQDMLGRQQ